MLATCGSSSRLQRLSAPTAAVTPWQTWSIWNVSSYDWPIGKQPKAWIPSKILMAILCYCSGTSAYIRVSLYHISNWNTYNLLLHCDPLVQKIALWFPDNKNKVSFAKTIAIRCPYKWMSYVKYISITCPLQHNLLISFPLETHII